MDSRGSIGRFRGVLCLFLCLVFSVFIPQSQKHALKMTQRVFRGGGGQWEKSDDDSDDVQLEFGCNRLFIT